MNTQKYWITFVRPVGSKCWTVDRVATTPQAADKHRVSALNRKITFAAGSVHLQSTATIVCTLPADVDEKQAAYATCEMYGLITRPI